MRLFLLVLDYLDIFSDIIYKVWAFECFVCLRVCMCVCVCCAIYTFEYIYAIMRVFTAHIDDSSEEAWRLPSQLRKTRWLRLDKNEHEEGERAETTKEEKIAMQKENVRFLSVFWCLEWVLCWAKGVLLQAIACVSPSKQSHIIFIFSLRCCLSSIFVWVSEWVWVRMAFHF